MSIAANIKKIQSVISQTATACGRLPQSVQLLAVSKGQSIQAIEDAVDAGLYDFGENYLQEAEAKIQALSNPAIRWHFIGPIQSKKIPLIARDFDWVHSVYRAKEAHLLSAHRAPHQAAINICLQVNLDAEDSKSGCEPNDLFALARLVEQLPGLNLRGLMTIPKPRSTKIEQKNSFLRLTELMHQLNSQGSFNMDTLSMGMSEDLEAAIEAGSTMVRVGRAIFGERQSR